MNKVGLVTCFLNNYGACLQAYALQKVITALGHECQIIRYSPNPEIIHYDSLYIKAKMLYRRIRGLFDNRYYYETSRIKMFNRFRKSTLVFGDKKFSSEDELYNYPFKYDYFVVGSDQLWNPIIHGGNNKAYLLDFVTDWRKKIAYAPSIGLSVFPHDYAEEFSKLLGSFKYLSCREETGCKIVEQLSGKHCDFVLDPTLLLNKEEWISFSNSDKESEKQEEPYIFCYLFSENQNITDFVDYVKSKSQIKIKCIPYTKRELESDIERVRFAGPKEFVQLIKNASLVITDSFHATAFSINLNVPFYSLMRNSQRERINMNSRIADILNFTGLTSRLVDCKDCYPKELSYCVDFSYANKIIGEKRTRDKGILKMVLNSNEV